MKKFLCFVVAGSLGCAGPAAHAELITGVAVVVNDAVITMGEINASVAPHVKAAATLYGNEQTRFEQALLKYRDEAMEQMVEDKLILHAFLTSGYLTNVVEAYIDKRIEEKIQNEYYGDRARLIRSLHEEGLTYEMFRRQMRDRFMIDYEAYQNSSNPHKILISPLKVDQYYQAHKDSFKMEDQVKLRLIVIPQSADSAPGTAKKMGEEILRKVDAGVPFAEMAAVYSSGSQRAAGGDRGWVDRTYFKPSLAQVAFALKPGEHSGVIEEPETCYVMMVDEVKPAHVKPLSEVRADIEHTLLNEENLRLRKLWIDRLKAKSYVNYY